MRQGRVTLRYADVVATLALAVALGGTGYAAAVLENNSVDSQHIKKGAVETSEVENRSLLRRDFKKGQIPQGKKGPPGETGAQGPTGIVAMRSGNSTVADVSVNANAWQFVGQTMTVTTNSTQRLTGTAVTALGLGAGADPQTFSFGLCFRPDIGGVVSALQGGNYVLSRVSPTKDTYSAVGSIFPGTGTWVIGACVRNPGPSAITNTDYVNVWFMVTN